MAVHNLGTTNNVEEKPTVKPSSAQARTGTRIGFGGVIGGSNFISGRSGSEYTASLSKEIKKYLQSIEQELTIKPEVVTLDRELLSGRLSYSVILVVSEDREKSELRYYTILLASTGQKAMTVGQMAMEIQDSKNRDGKPRIYTLDDAFNEKLHQIICEELAKKYTVNFVYNVDGMILSELIDEVEVEERGAIVGASAINAIYSDMIQQDLNITESLHEFPHCGFNITSNLNSKSTILSPSATPIRADFNVTLNLNDTMQAREDIMNSDLTNIELAKVVGFIDALPEETEIVTKLPNGQSIGQLGIRLRPNIIITGLATSAPTSGFALLSIITSIYLSKKDNYVRALFPADKKNNVGFLNKICGVGDTFTPLPIADNKYTESEISDAILSMFTLDPMISLDIENFGPQAYYTSVFSVAASPFSSQEREEARKYIIHLARELTNGNFPSDFPTDRIFSQPGICVPMGYYNTNHGVKDIRDIDMAFIASKTDDQGLIAAWQDSNYANNEAGIDPFITKVNVINEFIKDAFITSKAIRVTFDGLFIRELLGAATAAGFKAKYKSDFTVSRVSNIGVVRGTLNRGGLGMGIDGGAFNNTYGARGTSYNVSYGNMGRGRF